MAAGLLLTQRAAATLLGRDVKTIRKWTEQGVIPCFRDPDSGRPMYPLGALEDWMRSFATTVKKAGLS